MQQGQDISGEGEIAASAGAVANRLLERHFSLPPVPRVLSRFLDLMGSPRADATKAAEIIEADPALAAEVLKVVNSAYYGLPRPVTEMRFAIAYLGLGEISRIALTLTTVNALKPNGPGAEQELERFWLLANVTTLGARRISKEIRGFTEVGELYSAALLHSIGELLYFRCLPEEAQQIRDFRARNGVLSSAAERALGLPSHKALGAKLAKKWRLPATVARAAAFHDLDDLRGSERTEDLDPADIAVTVASLIAQCNLCPLNDSVREQIAFEVQRVMGIDPDAYLFLLGESEEWRLRAEALLRNG